MSYGVGLRNGVAFALGTIPSLTSGGGLRPSLLLDFLSGSLDPRITFSRGTQAMQYGSDGTLQYAPNNLLTYSNQADNAAWTKSNSFVQTNLLTFSDAAVANYTSISAQVVNTNPISGFTNSVAFPYTPSTNIIAYKSYTTVAGIIYTISAYVQMDDGGAPVVTTSPTAGDLTLVTENNPTPTNITVTSVGGGVYRVYASITALGGGTNTGIVKYNTQSARGFKVTGLQLVQGSVPGDYRATTSAALPVLYADYNGALRARKLCEGAAVSVEHYALQNSASTVAGTIHTGSWYVKAGERTSAQFRVYSVGAPIAQANFDALTNTISGISGGTWASASLGNGWYRVYSYIAIAGATGGVGAFTVSGGTTLYTGDGSSGIYIADAQLTPGYLPLVVTETTSAAVYGPRFDYDPVTKVARGLLIEEQRTNLATFSNTFSDASWTALGTKTVAVSGFNSPEGVANAWTLTDGSAVAFDGIQKVVTVAADTTTYTASVFLRKTTGGTSSTFGINLAISGGTLVQAIPRINTDTGAVLSGTATVNDAGSYWRVSCSVTNNASVGNTTLAISLYPATAAYNSGTDSAAATGSATIYGAQIETGAFATSYIPTVASTATRNADSASITTLTPWFNAAAGTFYVQGLHTNIPSSAAMALEIGDGTVNNRHAVFTAGTANCNYYDVVGGVNQATISASTFTANVVGKFSAAYALNDFQVAGNGTLGGSDISGSLPAGLTTMFIGNSIGSTSFWNGWLNSIRYYPTRLPNASLQSITA